MIKGTSLQNLWLHAYGGFKSPSRLALNIVRRKATEMAVEKQELHCHNCDNYVQFDIDPEENGEYEIECPNCDHMHCRVIKDGIITDKRWDSRNGWYSTVSNLSHSSKSNITLQYAVATGSDTKLSMFYQQSWANTTCAN